MPSSEVQQPCLRRKEVEHPQKGARDEAAQDVQSGRGRCASIGAADQGQGLEIPDGIHSDCISAGRHGVNPAARGRPGALARRAPRFRFGGGGPRPDAPPQPLGDGRVPVLRRRGALRAARPPAASARLPADGGAGQALRPGLPEPFRQPRGPGRGLLPGGLLGARPSLPRDRRRSAGPGRRASGGGGRAPLPALARDAGAGDPADVGPAGADVPGAGAGRRRRPGGRRRHLGRDGAGGCGLGGHRLPAAARPRRPPPAGRGALAGAGPVAPRGGADHVHPGLPGLAGPPGGGRGRPPGVPGLRDEAGRLRGRARRGRLPWPGLRPGAADPLPRPPLWARRHLPQGAGILVQDDLAPHAHFLLGGFDLAPVNVGLQRYAHHPYAPLWLFAEGESAWPGAATFRWPDTDAYGKLTRNHYRVVSLSPIPADYRYQVVRGVHAWEPGIQDPRWRWLEADAALRVFPQGLRAVDVTLALPEVAPMPANRVTVTVDGAPAASVELARGASRRLELPIAPGRPGRPDRPVEIAFHSDRSFVPRESGLGADSRHLAVQLLALQRIRGASPAAPE